MTKAKKTDIIRNISCATIVFKGGIFTPPKVKFTREQIIDAALSLLREGESITARGLAARLHASAKPIFGLFENMEEVQAAALDAAKALYYRYLKEEFEAGRCPPYKTSGMAYIRFAREEPALFRLLFMRDRRSEGPLPEGEELAPIIALIREGTGLNEEEARRLHLEMWIFVHGIAAMAATHYLDWTLELAESAVTDCYQGLLIRFQQKKGPKNEN